MTDSEPLQEISREDTAFYIRALWAALLVPKWLRNDLIDMGKAVHDKVPLASLNESLFARLMPKLTEISLALDEHLARRATSAEPASKERTARLIKLAWEALLAPEWTKDDLIDLGKSVYAKVPLASLDEAVFARLMPYLIEAARVLATFAMKQDLNAKYGRASEPGPTPVTAPAVPAVPAVPTVPTVPTVPAAPAIPDAPTVPDTSAEPPSPSEEHNETREKGDEDHD